MANKSSELSVRAGQTKRKKRSTIVEYTPSELLGYFMKAGQKSLVSYAKEQPINYSDIPPLTESQMKHAKRAKMGRPTQGIAPKKLISLKIDPFLLERIKESARKQGKPYQTLVSEILERYI